MLKRICLCYFLVMSSCLLFAQEKEQNLALGFAFGAGSEFKNTDYTFSNRYLKARLNYIFKRAKYFHFELALEPEVNFGKHQLLNLYFVTPDEPNFESKREVYTKLKDIREYVLNVGLIVRKPITEAFSIYALFSVGPMITDTETERQSKGFAFSDVLAIGVSLKTKKVTFDLRPNIRHTSNAGLQKSNAGFNTFNIEAGVSFPL